MAKGQRGEQQVRQFGGAMLHQLEVNKAKGDWNDPERPKIDSIWQLLYHMVKLMVELKEDKVDPVRVQEYAADVGNEAMIAADTLDTLDAVYRSEGHSTIEPDQYDPMRALTFDLHEVLIRHGVLPAGYEHPLLESEEQARGATLAAEEILDDMRKRANE